MFEIIAIRGETEQSIYKAKTEEEANRFIDQMKHVLSDSYDFRIIERTRGKRK